MGTIMHWYTRFWERFAIGILVRSDNISLLAFKDVELDQVIMAGSPDDPAAMAFIDANTPDDENYTDVFGINEMMIETDYIVEEQDEDESKNKNLVIGKNYRIIGTKDEITKESSNFNLYINLD